GDGVLQAGEQCDDGNTTGGDGCSADCKLEVNDCHVPRPVPTGANNWSYLCSFWAGCSTTFEDVPAAEGGSSTLVTVTSSPFDHTLLVPASKSLHIDATNYSSLGFWIDADNHDNPDWQGSSPVIVLGGPHGNIRYTPDTNLLPKYPNGLQWVSVPLA